MIKLIGENSNLRDKCLHSINTAHFLSQHNPVFHLGSIAQTSGILDASHKLTASSLWMEASHWPCCPCTCKPRLHSHSRVVCDLNAIGLFRGDCEAPLPSIQLWISFIRSSTTDRSRTTQGRGGGIAPALSLCCKTPAKTSMREQRAYRTQACTCILSRGWKRKHR